MKIEIAQTENIKAHLVCETVVGKSVPLEVYFTFGNDEQEKIILSINNNSVLMCGLISKQNKIEKFHQSLPEPAPPVSHSPKSPRFNFSEQHKMEEEETKEGTATLSI